MTEPFHIVRRKPAASATYGRKAMAARRIGSSHSPALASGPGNQALPLKAPSRSSSTQADAEKSDLDGHNAGHSSGSDTTDEAVWTFSKSNKSSSARRKPQENSEAAKCNAALDGSWTHRTAQSAMSKLDLLYQSTKSAEAARSGALQRPLDAVGDCWDLAGEDQARSEQKQHGTQLSSEAAELPKRIVLDNTDLIVTANMASTSLSADMSASTKRHKSKPRPGRGAARAFPKPPTMGSHKPQPVASAQTASLKTRPKPEAKGSDMQSKRARNGIKSRAGVGIGSSDSFDVSQDPAEGDSALLANLDAWDVDSLISGNRPSSQAKPAKRKASARTKSSNRKNAPDRRSSSPPSALSRQLERSRISSKSSDSWKSTKSAAQSQTSGNGSELEDMCGQHAQTPRAQINNKQILRSIQGPSSATSKRLQARAIRQGVVYTYGRNRGSGDHYSELEHMFGLSGALDAPASQRLLGHDSPLNSGDSGMNSDTDICEARQTRAIAAHGRHLLDLVDFSAAGGNSADGRASTTEAFKRQIGDILLAFSANSPGFSLETGCRLLLEMLGQSEFCDELLNSKYWLQTLLQTLYRSWNSAIVQPITVVVVACAFKVPTVMQSLVFDRQILETVAEALKLALDVDILSLRRRRDFDSPDQRMCVARICALARKQGLVGGALPISCYNIALSALHGFTCTDDAAFLAMAPLLRNEVRESGCLALVANRVFTRSIPDFVCAHKQPIQQQKGGGNLLSSTALSFSYSPFDDICATRPPPFKARLLRFPRSDTGFSDSSDSGGDNEASDDIWLDFDVPEGQNDIFSRASAASFKRRNKAKTKEAPERSSRDKAPDDAPTLAKDAEDLKRALRNEPPGKLPTFASIAVELELLRFCTSASSDSQSEMLEIDACVPTLLSLLTKCQEESTGLHGTSLIRALETVALTLQLLVNLANSSTVFSSKFIAERGLNAVSKSIALMAQRIKSDSFPSWKAAAASDFSPRRKALLDDANDLRYDILLTTSALLTNLVESDPSTALHFNHVLQSPRCLLNKQCFPECACSDRISLNVLLTQAFLACHAAGSSSPDAVVAAGYISVLLGFLMRGKTATRETILKTIPGRDASILIVHIERFIEISDSVDQRFGGLIGGLAKAAQSSQDSDMMHIASQDANYSDCVFGSDNKELALWSSNASASNNGSVASTKPSKMANSLRSIIRALADVHTTAKQ